MTTANPQLEQLCVNTIRALAIDTVQKANSGHPGLPLGAAPVGYSLFARVMKHNPANPAWPDRDRFVLSAGHGSALLYGLLHLTGYEDRPPVRPGITLSDYLTGTFAAHAAVRASFGLGQQVDQASLHRRTAAVP